MMAVQRAGVIRDGTILESVPDHDVYGRYVCGGGEGEGITIGEKGEKLISNCFMTYVGNVVRSERENTCEG